MLLPTSQCGSRPGCVGRLGKMAANSIERVQSLMLVVGVVVIVATGRQPDVTIVSEGSMGEPSRERKRREGELT